MSAFYIDQLQRLRTAKAKELLAADRLDDGKAANVAAPPSIPDQGIKIETGPDGMLQVTVNRP
ncbi:hypothetical protein [Mesorhizobium sp.]|uniref:hypothetical protein n=1 Tax=Mesorhizobium sp. TaxID=1871066 RepID=UPI003BAA3936